MNKNQKKAIILSHGLFMKKIVMYYMKLKLKEKGYSVYNFGYETRNFNEETLIKYDEFISKIKEDEIIFVCHSMGGLLTHLYLKKFKMKKKSMVITLGTPHKGSLIGNKVNNSMFRSVLGTSINAGLLNGDCSWNFKDIPLGCIVGTLNVGFLFVLGKWNEIGDGTVLKNEAMNENAIDICEVKKNHTGLIYSEKVINEIDYFIKNKKFKKN